MLKLWGGLPYFIYRRTQERLASLYVSRRPLRLFLSRLTINKHLSAKNPERNETRLGLCRLRPVARSEAGLFMEPCRHKGAPACSA